MRRGAWSATCRTSEAIRYRPRYGQDPTDPADARVLHAVRPCRPEPGATAQLLLDLLEHYPDRRDLVDQIKDREHEGDSVTHEIVQLVNKTFVTPIDGEDIYDLATALDDVCDFMDQVADELNLYGVDEVPPEAIEQAGVILKAVGKLADAIAGWTACATSATCWSRSTRSRTRATGSCAPRPPASSATATIRWS